MAKGLIWRDVIANDLFQFFRFREALAVGPVPYQDTVAIYLEDATRTGNKGHLAQLPFKCGQQFLGIPRSTKEPAALIAVTYLDSGSHWPTFTQRMTQEYQRRREQPSSSRPIIRVYPQIYPEKQPSPPWPAGTRGAKSHGKAREGMDIREQTGLTTPNTPTKGHVHRKITACETLNGFLVDIPCLQVAYYASSVERALVCALH